jgi:hypothetical protein
LGPEAGHDDRRNRSRRERVVDRNTRAYARATGGRYVAALMVDAGVTGADSFEPVRAAFFKGVVDKVIFGDTEAVDFGPNHTEAIPAGSADFVLVARLPQLGA